MKNEKYSNTQILDRLADREKRAKLEKKDDPRRRMQLNVLGLELFSLTTSDHRPDRGVS